MGKLSRRLAALARQVPPGSVVADVGADHAALVIALVASGRCPRGIATDARPGPAAMARERVAAAGLADRISVRLGDGLEPLEPGEADALVIAGLGGVTIANILAGGPGVLRSARRLVLQPMVAAEVLRRRLDERDFSLVDEDLVAEAGRWYEILVAEPAAPPAGLPRVGAAVRRVAVRLDLPEDTVWECGPVLAVRRPAGFADWVREKRATYDRILEEMARAGAAAPADADRFRLRREGLAALLEADRPARRITPD